MKYFYPAVPVAINNAVKKCVLFFAAFFLMQGVFAQVPVITSFSSYTGMPGGTISINGSGFNTTMANNIVYFGGVKATVSSANATSVTVTIPAGVTYQPVTVTNTASRLTGYSRVPFLTTFTPSTQPLSSGSFGSVTSLTSNSSPTDILEGDLDGDGKLDLAVGGSNGTISFYHNISTGAGNIAFAAKSDVASIGTLPVLADMDGDGKLDIIAINSTTFTVNLNASTSGTISFPTNKTTAISTTLMNAGMTVGDIDGDGKPDVVISSFSDGKFRIFRNTSTVGNLSFAAEQLFNVNGFYSVTPMIITDVDGDGIKEVVQLAYGVGSTSNIKILHFTASSGTFTLASTTTFNTGYEGTFKLAMGDVDGDHLPDIIIQSQTAHQVVSFRNTSSSGSISFGSAVVTNESTTAANPGLALGALTGNAKVDMVTGGDLLQIFKNGSSGTTIAFGTGSDVATTTVNNIVAGDFDNDGKTDIAEAPGTGSAVKVYRNTANEAQIYSFSPSSASAGTTITINGAYFTGATAVKINGTAVNSFTVVSDNVITAVAGGSTTGNITVATPTATTGTSATQLTMATYTAPGNALIFDWAKNNYVQTASNPLTAGGDFTIEFWMKDSLAGTGTVTAGNNWYNGTGLVDGDVGGLANDFGVSLLNNKICFGTGGTADFSIYTNASIVAGRWVHVAAVRSKTNGSISIYINGVLDTTHAAGTAALTSPPSLAIGSNTGHTSFFTGAMDEVRFFNTARTAANITADMAATIPTNTTGLVTYYTFDEGTAAGTNTTTTTLLDQTGTVKGTLNGFTLTGATSNWVASYAMVIPTATAATGIAGTTFTANWSAPAVGTATSYLLDVSTSPTFSSFVSGYNAKVVSGTSPAITGLSQSTTYYYRVRAENSSLSSPNQGSYSNTITAVTIIDVPTITSFTPSSVQTGGTITINGTNFIDGTTTVTVGGVAATVLTNTGTVITARVPDTYSGSVVVTTTLGGTVTKTGFTLAAPVISSFAPVSAAAGATVTITGTGFSTTAGRDTVYFGDTKAAVTAATNTSLSVTVPTGATYQPISVTTLGLTGYSPKPFTLTFTGGTATLNAKSFTQAINSSSDYNASFIKMADIDGDGKPDMIQGGPSSQLGIRLNTSSTSQVSFGTVTEYNVTNLETMVVDINGDGKLDILAGETYLNIILNSSTPGNLSFAPSQFLNFSGFGSIYAHAVGDIDGDGRPDVVVQYSNHIVVYRNTSSGTIISFDGGTAFNSMNIGADNFAHPSLAISDIDGDGKADIIASNPFGTELYVFRNTSTPGSLSLAAHADFTTDGNGQTVSTADIDGDGKQDIIVQYFNSGTFSIFQNTTSGTTISFAAKTDFAGTATVAGIGIGDLNGDGKPDLSIAQNNLNNSVNVGVWINTSTTGSISFSASDGYGNGSNYISTAIADVDGDGKPDVIAADQSEKYYVFRSRVGAPIVTSFTPASAGKDSLVTITGASITSSTPVTFGGIAATAVAVVNSTTFTAKVGAGTSGYVAAGTGADKDSVSGFTFVAAPTITGITPTTDSIGQTVTITGTNFTNAGVVSFGGVNATSFTVTNSTTIKAVIPAGITPGAVTTLVRATGGQATFTGPTVIAHPVITSLSAQTGTGGTSITITGTDLTGATAVSFGGAAATINSSTSTSITVTLVSGGSGNVLVVTPGGTAIAPLAFVYDATPTITSFTTPGTEGSTVTITGNNFTGVTSVTFGGIAAAHYTVNSSTSITAIMGAGATGSVQVTTANGTATKTGFTLNTLTAPGNFLNILNGSITANTGSLSVTGNYTVELWVIPTNSFPMELFTTSVAGGNAFDLIYAGSSNQIRVSIGNGSSSLVNSASFPLAQNSSKWVHLACAVSPTGYTLYADGAVLGSGTFTGTPLLINSSHNQLNIGTPSPIGGSLSSVYGQLDEIKIWSETRTQAQVQADMVSAVSNPTTQSTLVAYYNFDEGTSGGDNRAFTYLVDASANNFTGILNNVARDFPLQNFPPSGYANYGTSTAMMAGVISNPTNIKPSSFTANWQAPVTGTPDSYLLDVSTNAGFTSLLSGYNGKSVTGNSAAVSGLTAGTAYFYRVRPVKNVTYFMSFPGGGSSSETVPYQGAYSSGVAVPIITSYTPHTGGKDTVITITGTNLSGATAVTIGGTAISFTVNNSTSITATVAAGTTSGNLVVTTPAGVITSDTAFTFFNPITIASVSPSQGNIGATVTITGTGFTGATAVTFGGVPALAFTVVSDAGITATVPQDGTGTVLVTSPGGTATGSFTLTTLTPPGNTLGFGGGVVVPTGSLSVTGNYTAEAWIMINGSNSVDQPVVVTQTGNATFKIAVKNFAGLHLDIGDGTNFIVSKDITFNYSYAKWYHIACAVSTSGYTVYIDGVAVDSGSFSATTVFVNSANNTLSIGYQGVTESFVGNIDEVKIWSITRSATDVAADMLNVINNPASATGLVAYYNFDEGVAGGNNKAVKQLIDLSANNLTGTLTGYTGSLDLTSSYNFKNWVESYAMVKATATAATNITNTSATFNFTPPVVGAVDYYTLDITTSPTFAFGQYSFNVTGDTTVGSLQPNTTYYYRVKPRKASVGDVANYSATISVTTNASATLSSFTPAAAGTDSVVVIAGTNFTDADTVRFGGVDAKSFTINSSTQITAVVGTGGASGSVTVVTASHGTATKTGFTYFTPLSLTSFTPNQGGIGAPITLTGTGFSSVTAVSIGGITASSFTAISDNSMIATVGKGATGSISVTSLAGTVTLPGFTLGGAQTPPGNALFFDGVKDYVTVNALPVFGTFTIEFWMNTTQTGSNTGTNWYNGSALIDADVAGKQYDYGISLLGSKLCFGTGGGFFASDVSIISHADVNTGHWVHVAIVRQNNSGQYQMYINGVLDVSGSGVIGTLASPTTITLGASNTSHTSFYNGYLDEVRMFSTDRTANIASDMVNTVSLNTNGFVTYYNFDEGTAGGTNTGANGLVDLVGNNNGTLHGFTLAAGNTSNWVESYAIVVPGALATTGINGTGFILNWAKPAVGNTVNYVLDVSLDSTFTTASLAGYSSKVVTGTQQAVTGLTRDTKYWWRVRADTTSSVAGQGAYTAAALVTTVVQPSITSFTPATASKDTLVTIKGTNFTGADNVYFGGVAASSFTVVSDTVITAVVGAGASGSVSVSNTPDGTASKTGFTYFNAVVVTAFTPQQAAQGTQVDITGAGFTGASAVTFGGTPALSFTVVADGHITAFVGKGTAGSVVVTVNGHSSSLAGFTLANATPPANALNFGAGTYASVSTGGKVVNGSFTVEAWVYPTNPTAEMSIISSRVNAEYGFDMKLKNGNQLHADVGYGSNWVTTGADATFNYSVGHWYHITYVVTTAGYTIYANGQQVGSGGGNGITPVLFDANHNKATIGSNGGGEVFNGSIDELKIWNTARTAQQVQADMLNVISSPATETGLVAYYNFDEGAAGGNNAGVTTLFDQSANNLNATLVSGFALTGNTGNWMESYAMVVPTATTATNISGSGFTANWSAPAVGAADNYLLDVATDANFNSIVSGYASLVVTGTSLAVTGLSPATNYWYRVRADKASVTGQGAFSATITTATYGLPTITSFTPTTAGNNAPVSITGTNFTGTTDVSFGGTTAKSFVINSKTQITAYVNAGTSGNVTVTNLVGTATAGGFIYSLPTAAISAPALACTNNGPGQVTFTGNYGIAPYTFTYTLNGGNQTVTTTTGNTVQVPVPLLVGTYNYVLTGVQDNNGYTQSQTGTASVTVSASTDTTYSDTACSTTGFVWHGNTYNTTGTYSFTGTNAAGCDSVETLLLVVKQSSTSTEYDTTCAETPFVWNGHSYSSTGTYTFTTTNSVGCDSVATLVLTVRHPASATAVAFNPASPYTWNGTTYTVPGTYTYTTVSAGGCDSVATLVLTENAPSAIRYNTPVVLVKDTTASPLAPIVTPAGTQTTFNPPNTFIIGRSVVTDAAGNVYVDDNYYGQIIKLAPNGTIINSNFANNIYANSLAIDAQGNIYAASPDNHAVYKISADGNVTSLADGSFQQPYNVAVDANGNVFVADASIAGVTEIVAGTDVITNFWPHTGIVISVATDAAGNIYAGDQAGTITKIKPDGTGAVVLNTIPSSVLSSIAIDAGGTIYITDVANGILYRLAPNGSVISATPGFNSLNSVAADVLGNVFVAQNNYYLPVIKISGTGIASNYTIAPALPAGLAINAATGIISGTPVNVLPETTYMVTASNAKGSVNAPVILTVTNKAGDTLSYNSPNVFAQGAAINPLTPVISPAPLPADTVITLGSYTGAYVVGLDGKGGVYVLDGNGSGVLSKLGPDGKTEIPWGNNSITTNSSAMVADSAGNLYITDGSNGIIRKIRADGSTITILNNGYNYGYISGMAIDAAGNIYASRLYNDDVIKIAPDGTYSTITSGLYYPYGVAVDGAGYVYVTEPYANRFSKIAGDGTGTVVYTNGDVGGSYTIAVDKAGDVFLGENNGNGNITEIAADGTISHFGSNLYGVYNLVVDGNGIIYEADANNTGHVYKVASAGQVITGYTVNPLLPAGLAIDAATGIISGTPTTAAPKAIYTVTAARGIGNLTAPVDIKVGSPDTTNAILCLPGVYHWNGNDYSAAGIYTTHITLAGGRDSVAVLSLTAKASPTAAAIRANQQITTACYGLTRKLIATPTGGTAPYLYSIDGTTWQDSARFEEPAGTYHIIVKDNNGCTVTTGDITLTQPAEKLVITGTQVTGADITVTATGGYGGYTYSLDGGAYSTSNTLTGVSAGIDTVRVHDQGGCVAAARVNILTATVTYDGGNNMACYNRNKTITITPAGGVRPYRYTFDGNTAGRIMLAAPGTHTITVQDAAGNSYSTGITITAPAEKLNLTLAHSNATCAGGDGSITALPSGGYAGYTYSINSGSYAGENVFNNLDAGTYTVSAMDAAGCTSPVRTAIVKVPVNPCPGLRSGDEPTSSKGEMAGALVVKVMPNPAVVEFTLQVVSGDSKKVVEIRVMDMLGRTVYHTRGSVFDSYRFGRSFAGGMYIAEVLNGTSIQRVKLVKGN